MKVLSNDILRPSLLERHFKQQHPILVSMTTFFSSEAESLKRMRLDKSGSYYTSPTSEYIFNSVSNYVEKNNLDWSKLFGFCINRASAMIGVQWGLAKQLKDRNPAMVSTHCVIHR
nr:unnamed protein product [Callosobruchus analis]